MVCQTNSFQNQDVTSLDRQPTNEGEIQEKIQEQVNDDTPASADNQVQDYEMCKWRARSKTIIILNFGYLKWKNIVLNKIKKEELK